MPSELNSLPLPQTATHQTGLPHLISALPVVVVDLVPEARGVRHCQLHLHPLLLDD